MTANHPEGKSTTSQKTELPIHAHEVKVGQRVKITDIKGDIHAITVVSVFGLQVPERGWISSGLPIYFTLKNIAHIHLVI